MMTLHNNRVLIVDDNRAIHEDFRKILVRPAPDRVMEEAEAVLFDRAPESIPQFELTSAHQGTDALALAEQALAAGRPFALAFIDVRMPPGIDGVTTAARLWEIDPDVQVVICTAYADHSWGDMTSQLRHPHQWVILRKPFDNVEVLQLAHALTAKWTLIQQTKAQLAGLEQRVQARTNDLVIALDRLRREGEERAQLDEQRRQLERKMEETQRLESLGVLAGGIAHDFNNILTGVLGSASLARMECPPQPSLHRYLAQIEKSALRAAELCEQMLAYAGKGQMVVRTIDVNGLVQETLELLHASVPRDATLTVHLSPDLPRVQADPARLRQVVMNLVINAAEALSGSVRQVSLTTRTQHLQAAEISRFAHPCDAAAGSFVCIEVADTGCGMGPETLRRIFDPFFTTKFTGRGLGLCAVLGILRSRGGALDLQSDVGKGSVFRAFLPESTVESPAPPSAATIPPASHPSPALSATILVVDDEAAVRDTAAGMLRRAGYAVLLAANGRQAVELFEKSPAVDGVLLDLTMPEMDGVATLQALRALQPHVRALLMSGFDGAEATKRFQGLKLHGFLQKPFSMDALREKIAALVMGGASGG